MVGRAGVVLVLAWACWAGIGRVLANHSQCDVQALRCDVICSFPDLDLHCSRCIRRRPMRFGKRSRRVLQELSDGPSGEPLAEGLSSQGSTSLRTTNTHDRKSTSAITTEPKERAARRGRQDVRALSAGPSHLFSRILWNDSVRKTDAQRELRESYSSDPNTRPHPTGWRQNLDFNVDDYVDMEEHRTSRRRRGNTYSTLSDSVGSSSSSEESHSGRSMRLPATRRTKRSEVLEVVEGLMDMLGLEELPVDPTLYGCHELRPVLA
ncbi:uncharacterized protein [Procambarus clarkii]|uniref:uncharacterized protein n=1 Tax=Procambarus clarkii TaxID=6728 RepID=UPI001E673BF1|nr:uncharacterized protein LOC123768183 [Procambarus clarkii]